MLLIALALIAATDKPPANPAVPRQIAGSISDSDYPAPAIRALEQGTTTVMITVGREGGVEECAVVAKSGSATLDGASCALVTERFRFEPARDPEGRPVRAKVKRRIAWRLPDIQLEEGAQLQVVAFDSGMVKFAMASDDFGTRCAAEAVGESFSALAEALCPPQVRVPLSDLLANPDAMLTISTFTPEGAPPAPVAPPARGTLMGRVGADYAFGPDGKIISCTHVDLPGATGTIPSPCQMADYPLPAVEPNPSIPIRRARISHDVYRLGAPIT